MSAYRSSLALGGSDIRAMITDYDAWKFERDLILSGGLPPWMQKDPSAAAEFGTAVHLALLEPHKYNIHAKVMPYVENFTLKEGRAVKEQARLQCILPGDFIIRHEHDWAIQQMRNNYRAALKEAGIFEPMSTEVELEFADIHYDVEVKGRVDAIVQELVIDLKTISDIHRRSSVKIEAAYHCQLAHYAELARLSRTAIVWIESVAPYRVIVERISSDEHQQALRAREIVLRRYAKEFVK